ncbi:HAMP domain-containing sensor histidine kinase [Chryseobacterium gambrini]|uniref:histidine kinase n=1 Tax=Chryseobacterium gambrini TaxID=373672 RepID=A0AAJ1R6M1_9FLAO|nr:MULTISPECIES: HAMP domain-containing sensor histidine kinase [Chryseobacterium]MDN4014940.1 HAMP domain-containing sensor histidine kinase [Chryseobacterium gambrini]MDN4031659.1 HAMP domain-containing sensor histidine kinase [Chryseobacterium gambrini]QWA37958.1 HAMP domain-containing histidine kinase [Chryseobacterium sp. ZHDP1]
MSKKLLNFKARKIIHYSLLVCILLIQLLIAGYFYNEFISRKNLAFFENQLKEVHTLENLTDNSRGELLNAQNFLQKYMVSNDNTYLNSYFASLNKLGKNLDSIGHYENKYPKLKNVLTSNRKDSMEIKKLKSLIDSTYEYSTKSNFKVENNLPKLEKYSVNYDFDKFKVETKTISDTVKKKGLFGRLGDAISGKENVRKESTIITVKQGKEASPANIKAEFDSIFNEVNNHYKGEIKKIQVNVVRNQNNSGNFYKIFNNLMVYSNGLMNIYDVAIKDSKAELEKEYQKQNSESNRIRKNLVFGAMILMFIVSVLIMFLTRIAFIYEKKLNAANKQISENLNFKNRILGMLSHELRSPLKIIGLFINRINKRTEDEKVKEYLKSISFTNDSLLMQANQILEYTKNQAVENKLIPVKFNLKSEITSILTSIEPYIETRNNKFIIDENINPDINVYSDNKKINQIFMNILGNANKFTENGQIKVTAKTQPVDENTISLITEISDTGVGISKSDLEKIFEPYYQGVLSEDVENLGAGLGLSLCKEIIGLYDGDISVSSEEGKGTTVHFSVNLNISK